ncbi:MAG TPA: DUF2278 family protein [Solirubrobacterales bacterium]
MPLPGYGVAIGSLVSFTRDSQHNFGSWYHGHVTLDADGVRWESALDVDAPQSVGVAYRLVTGLTSGDLGPVSGLPAGWTPLTHSPSSGALDYVRSPVLRDGPVVRALRSTFFSRGAPRGWRPPPPDLGLPGGPQDGDWGKPPFPPDPIDSALERSQRLLSKVPMRRRSFPWIDSSGDNALDALQPYLDSAARIYIYGERYKDGGNGVHDVHLNQGDPVGSRWFDSDGIWQDGAVACQRSDDAVAIWQVRFKTQSLSTDAGGHPA